MKGFIRSKLPQTLATFVIIAIAIVVPLSGNSIRLHAAPASSQASWNIVPSPNSGTYNSHFESVATVSSNDIWAVGSDAGNGGYYRNLTEHWDGSNWTVKSSPNIGSSNNQLHGVAAVSVNNVWAVGSYSSSITDPHT